MKTFRMGAFAVVLLSVCASSLAFHISTPVTRSMSAKGRAAQYHNHLTQYSKGAPTFSPKLSKHRKTTVTMQAPKNRDWKGMAHGIKPRVVGDGIGGERDPMSIENLAAALRFTLFNFSTIGWVALGSFTVYACSQANNFYWDANFNIIATGLIFPKAFSLSHSFGRRERAARTLGRLKAHVISLLWIFRDWDATYGVKAGYGGVAADNCHTLLQELEAVFYHDGVYRALTSISAYNRITGEKSLNYTGLHQSSQIIFYLSIVFLSPYWLNFCPEGSTSSCPAAYFNSITFVVVLNSLYRIHDAMENPYDMKGLDDIFFTTTNELRRIHEGAKTFLQPYPFDPETGLIAISDPATRFEEVENDNNGHVLRAKGRPWEEEGEEHSE